MDCTRHLTAPIGFVPNISHSDTEDQIGEDLEYFINTTWESPAQQQGEKQELADYLPWIGTVLEFPALKQCWRSLRILYTSSPELGKPVIKLAVIIEMR